MKTNHIFFLLILLSGTFSCAKETAEVVLPDPETDPYQLAATYNRELSAFGEGWIVRYQLEEETEMYTVYMKFHSDHTATLLSDYPDADYLEEQNQVAYTLSGFLNTELSFTTYCVWHRMYDDFGGDYQFLIARQEDGNYTLQPKNKAIIKYYTLEKASPEALTRLQADIASRKEKVAEQNKLKDISDLLIHFADDNSTYFKNIHLEGDHSFDGAIEINTGAKQVKIVYRNENRQAITLYSDYDITRTGISLKTPMTINGGQLTHFNLKKSGSGNNMDLLDDNGRPIGSIYVSHTPGVSPYPDIASNYSNMHLFCYVHLYNGEEFTNAYLHLSRNLPKLTSLQVYTNHYANAPSSSAWVIYDGSFSRYYVTTEALNESTLKYTYKSNNNAGKYPYISLLLDYISSPKGFTVLYSKKRYASSDLGSVVLIDSNNSKNYIILRVLGTADYNPLSWATIDWNNVVYGE